MPVIIKNKAMDIQAPAPKPKRVRAVKKVPAAPIVEAPNPVTQKTSKPSLKVAEDASASKTENVPIKKKTSGMEQTAPAPASVEAPTKGAPTKSMDLVAPKVDLNKPIEGFGPDEVSAATDLVNKEIAKASQKQQVTVGSNVPFSKVKKIASPMMSDVSAKYQGPITEEPSAKKTRPLGLYKKIAFGFSFLTIILIGAILYYTFVKVDIVLTPKVERVSNNLIFDVYDKNKNTDIKPGAISGAVQATTVETSKKYSASGLETIGEEVVGKITIINNYNRTQTLVATTRLLSADNKLFRMKTAVTIPAGGSVDVEVYADKPNLSMAVDTPTKWTIPGLWAGLQDKIYGENKDPLKYQAKVKGTISQSDIDQAEKDLKDLLLAKAKTQLADNFKSYTQLLYNIDDKSITTKVDAKAGDERADFTVSMKADVIVAAFNDEQAIKLAQDKISGTIPDNKELSGLDKGKMIYDLSMSDASKGIATVNTTFEGNITLKPDAVIVDKNKIVGLNKDQLSLYLASLPDLAGSQVTFHPSFITKVPDLVDRINIVIKK